MKNARRHLACGTCILALLVGLIGIGSAQDAPTYTVLCNFTGEADGSIPFSGVIEDAVGNLYGTTEKGGKWKCSGGCGVVFKLDATGKETVLYSFTGRRDGLFPRPGVIRTPAGTIYGTTSYGGSAFDGGTAFRLDVSGKETVLNTFTGWAYGAIPGPIRNVGGTLYGTAGSGGDTLCNNTGGCGLVFKMTTRGVETVLYTFAGGTDGESPIAGVIRDAAGNLLGTTQSGGNASCIENPGFGCGTVFKVDPSGSETVLHAFAGGTDGAFPDCSGVVEDAAGNLYGTTALGGAYNSGIVFKVDASGNETVLYTFTGGTDGGGPMSGVIRDTAGNLYGTALTGGNLSCNSGHGFGCGTVFELDSAGHEHVVHTFSGGDGIGPSGAMILDAAGNLYGTTTNGGRYNRGVVFKLKP